MAKPSLSETKLEWASDSIFDPESGEANKQETTATLKTNGVAFLEKIKFYYLNYWMNLVYQYIKYIIQEALEGTFTFVSQKIFTDLFLLPTTTPTNDNHMFSNKYIEDTHSAFNNLIPEILSLQGELNIVGVGRTSLAAMTSSRIAFADENTNVLQTYDFDGSAWSAIGASIGITMSGPALAALSDTRIALIDNNNDSLRAYDFDGANWTLTGSGLTITGLGAVGMTALSSSRIVLADASIGNLQAYDFSGSAWSTFGDPLAITGAGARAVAALSSTRIAYIDGNNDSLTTYDFNGTYWTQTGNSTLISAGMTYIYMSAISTDTVVFVNDVDSALQFYRFDGADWDQIGSDFDVSGLVAASIVALSSSRIATIDSSIEYLRLYPVNWCPNNY